MRRRRAAFTLFELILAVALAAVLLTLIGMAINLYLMRVDTDRTRVEEAQLARSVLTMIADDLRSASVYQKQDTSAIAALMAAGTPYDTDDWDKARQTPTGGATGAPGGTAAAVKLTGMGGSTSGASAGGASAGSGASSMGGMSAIGGESEDESDDTMPLGLSGSSEELYVDATRLPPQDELFSTVTGYTNAPSAASSNPGGSGSSTVAAEVNPPADLKTVHYYVRQGAALEPGSAAATSLAPDAQSSAGGLVREEIPRRMRVFAEQTGNSDVVNTSGMLVAPEVTQIQFKYYDGSQLTDAWDMKELKKLPIAIEVCIWLRSARAASSADSTSADSVNSSRVYRQVVYLPMAQQSESEAANAEAASQSSTTSSSSSTSSTTGSSSTSGSAFGEQ
jgi:type II secretory pathway pseudopilin PulG